MTEMTGVCTFDQDNYGTIDGKSAAWRLEIGEEFMNFEQLIRDKRVIETQSLITHWGRAVGNLGRSEPLAIGNDSPHLGSLLRRRQK